MLALVGLHEKAFGFNPTAMTFAENTIVGCIAYRPDDFRSVIDAMAQDRYNTEGWVSRVPLEEAERALRELRAGKGMKILVQA